MYGETEVLRKGKGKGMDQSRKGWDSPKKKQSSRRGSRASDGKEKGSFKKKWFNRNDWGGGGIAGLRGKEGSPIFNGEEGRGDENSSQSREGYSRSLARENGGWKKALDGKEEREGFFARGT